MSRETTIDPGVNRILRELSEELLGEVLAIGWAASFEAHEVLNWPGDGSQVFFPTSGLIAIVVGLASGATAEAVLVGREGMIGAGYVPYSASDFEHVVQVPSEGLVIRTDKFMTLLEERPALALSVVRFYEVLLQRAVQSVGCARAHSAEERLARWLVLCYDLTGEFEIPVTQEFLSQMIAAGRPTVNTTVGELERAGVLSHRRGLVRITDLAGLENLACECLEVQRAFERAAGVLLARQ